MDLKFLLFSFQGRIGRLQYFLAALGAGAAGGLVMLPLLAFVLLSRHSPLALLFAGALAFTLSVAMMWVGLALQIKRIQDRDRNWYFIFVSLIPFVGPVWLAIETYFIRGTVGDNRFGPDPLASRP